MGRKLTTKDHDLGTDAMLGKVLEIAPAPGSACQPAYAFYKSGGNHRDDRIRTRLSKSLACFRTDPAVIVPVATHYAFCSILEQSRQNARTDGLRSRK
jgi:hypothetical protein